MDSTLHLMDILCQQKDMMDKVSKSIVYSQKTSAISNTNKSLTSEIYKKKPLIIHNKNIANQDKKKWAKDVNKHFTEDSKGGH